MAAENLLAPAYAKRPALALMELLELNVLRRLSSGC
jgi:hypothetical protein